ncbi:MAG: adenylosuccinate synthase [Desulfovibrio sp.]|jgi:adenylosuccinate synthase|nr:adenylosuccinate synthase [Desulfovibrio sp.]
MSNIVIIGAQWGDEGKGKIVDMLAPDMDAVVRFQGGHNAGHTVSVGGKTYKLKLIPSGILHKDKICLVGNGVVLDPREFCAEMDALIAEGLDLGPGRLKISRKCHLILPYHQALDQARETSKGDDKIGTTGRGIGPCYEDKAARVGIRACDLEDFDLLRGKIHSALKEKNALLAGLYGQKSLDPETLAAKLKPVAARLAPYLTDVSEELSRIEARGGRIMFEGAQGVHLDIDHGTYPFVTSSNTVAGNAAAGGGIAHSSLHRVVGVAKAYTTRVGSGAFPTELTEETGRYIQQKGAEIGTVTGRKRRCGWLDAVVLRESVRLCGVNDFALTKLDVLSGLPEVKICTEYVYRGRRILYPPQAESGLAEVEPVYESLPGWHENLSAVRVFSDLPEAARNYIARLEALTGVPVGIVSVGANREQTVMRGLKSPQPPSAG